jgi:hypothetical protein
VNTLVKDLKCLGTQDVIVINGGSNDIGSKRNQTHKILVQMTQFIQENTHSNIIIVNTPSRHDIGSNSITNLEIQTANRKLNKIAKAYNNVTIVESKLHRKYFTQHGMHLNKPFMSLNVLRSTYFSYAHSIMSYGLIFWQNSTDCDDIFKIQKKNN